MEPAPRRKLIGSLVALFAASLGWRLYLIAHYPVVHSFDAFSRLWERETLFVSHWLPLPQLPVVLWNEELVTVRAVYALVGSLAVVALTVAVARLWSVRAAIVFGAVAWALPPSVHWTIVPSQEGFFLLFFGLWLVCWSRGPHAAPPVAGWSGGIAAACACASRYDAWLLLVLFAATSARKGKRRGLRYLLPGALVIVAWATVHPLIEAGAGPPRLAPRLAPIWETPLELVPLLMATWNAALFRAFLEALTGPGLLLMLWGLVAAYRRGEIVGRELLLFFLASIGLVFVRTWSTGLMTSHANTVMHSLALAYAVAGGWDLVDRFTQARAWKPAWRPGWLLLVPASALLAFLSMRQGQASLRQAQRPFLPEALLADGLGRLPTTLSVRVTPRRASAFGQSMIGAIFAQNLALDWRDARWSFPGKPLEYPQAEPQAFVTWSAARRAYYVKIPLDPKRAAQNTRSPGLPFH